jgi:hypothetical protein
VRRQLVAAAVAGQEGDPPAPDIADGERRGRRPVGRLQGDLDGVVEKRIEAGTAEDADLGLSRALRHAILLSVLELLDDESEEDDEDDEDDESEEDDEEDEDDVDSFSLALEGPLFPLPRLSVL